jgi:hypothetical protein
MKKYAPKEKRARDMGVVYATIQLGTASSVSVAVVMGKGPRIQFALYAILDALARVAVGIVAAL